MKEFFKKFKLDIIITIVLLLGAIVGVVCFSVFGKSKDNIAYIYVSNELVETIDLGKEKEEPRLLTLDGKYGEVVVQISKNDIKIIESTCPNKNCIHQGSATTLKPVICAYNEVCIELKGKKPVDVEVG